MPDPAPMSRARAYWVLGILCASVGLVVASITTLYIAGPQIARDIGESQTELTWIIDVYTLAMAGLLLPAGALGDRFGRRGVMIAGLGIFARCLWTCATQASASGPPRSLSPGCSAV